MNLAEKVLVARRSIEVIKKTCEQYNISPEKISKDSRLEYEYKLWAGTQMRYIPTGVLSDEEVDVYREFDFDFGIRPLKWEEWEEGYELGKWLNRQIINRKTLSPEHFEKIKLIKRDLSRESKEKGIKIQYNGRIFKSAKEFSKEMGIPLNIVYSGIHHSMNAGEIIDYYKRLRKQQYQGRYISYEGMEFYNTREFAEYYNINYDCANRYFHEGYDPKTVIQYCKYGKPRKRRETTTATNAQLEGHHVSYNGKDYISIKQFAEEYKIDYNKAIYYLNLDYSPQEVIHRLRWEEGVLNTTEVFYNGVNYKSIRELAFYNRIPYKKLLKLLYEGNSIEQAVELHKKKHIRLEGRHVLYNGKDYISIKQFAEECKIDYNKAVCYLNLNYSPQEVIHRLRWEEGVLDTAEVFYSGVNYKSIRELAFYNKIPYKKLLKLLYEGNSIEQAVELLKKKHIRKPLRRTIINYNSHEFESVKVFANYYGLSYQSVLLKLKSGWSYDEIVHPDKYETHKKLLVYKAKTPDEEEVIKWEKSVNSEDNLRAAKAFYYGKGIEQNYERAFKLLYKIRYYETQAEFLLALCYLYGRGTTVDAMSAIKLLEGYDSGTKRGYYARDEESGMMKQVIPYLLEAYKNVLFSDYGNLEALEKLDQFAVAFNNKDAQAYLYMYYTDINNFYRDSYEAIKYMRMINDHKTIKKIHAKYPNCKFITNEIEDMCDEECAALMIELNEFEIEDACDDEAAALMTALDEFEHLKE